MQGTSAFEPEVPPNALAPGEAEPGSQPDIRKLGHALRERVEVRSLSITGLFVLASFYTLYFAKAFFLPIILAVLLDFLLSPLIRGLKRARIPEPLGPRWSSVHCSEPQGWRCMVWSIPQGNG